MDKLGRQCPNCNIFVRKIIFSKNGFPLYRCGHCTLLFCDFNRALSEITDIYDRYYDAALFKIPHSALKSLYHLVDSLSPYRKTNRWLDVGYGEGGLLNVTERFGWKSYGLEVSPKALEYGKSRGWTVATNANDFRIFPESGFDVVSMIEVVEHLLSLDGILRTANKLLRPGGVLYITTPNGDSLNYRLLGHSWSVVSPPEHLMLWTRHAIRIALRRNGFIPRYIRTEGLNLIELLFIATRYQTSSSSNLRNNTGIVINELLNRRLLTRSIKYITNRILSQFALGDTLKIYAYKRIIKSTQLSL